MAGGSIVLLRRKFRVNGKRPFVILTNDVRAFEQEKTRNNQ